MNQGPNATKVAAIQATGTGSLVVNGCDFKTNGPQVELSGNMKRAVISGNLFTGSERILGSAASLQVGLNAHS
jgi:hypothetical protein